MKWRTNIKVPAVTHGWGEHKRTIPALVATIEVEIDLDRMFQRLGEKAARSKGRRSKALGGMVKVKALKITEVT